MNSSFELASISFRSWPGQKARPAPAIDDDAHRGVGGDGVERGLQRASAARR